VRVGFHPSSGRPLSVNPTCRPQPTDPHAARVLLGRLSTIRTKQPSPAWLRSLWRPRVRGTPAHLAGDVLRGAIAVSVGGGHLKCRAGGDRRRRRIHRDRDRAHSTVKEVVAVTPCTVAVMVVFPDPIVVASPFCPSALLIVATPGLDEDQLTELVRNRCVPSL